MSNNKLDQRKFIVLFMLQTFFIINLLMNGVLEVKIEGENFL